MKCKSKYSNNSDNIFEYEIIGDDQIKISKKESSITITKQMYDVMFEDYD